MQFKNIITLLPLLTAAATAFVVPHDLGDGTFHVTFDAEGKAQVARFDPKTKRFSPTELESRAPDAGTSAKYGKQLAARDSTGKTGRTFGNHDDYNSCTQGMKDTFNNGLQAQSHSIYYVTRGQAFLALCNYAGHSQGGYAYEVDDANRGLDNNYGAWQTGWYFFSGPNKTMWRDLVGTKICENI